MPNLSTFQVYSASAGSGKTYTLVREYLQILLQNKDAYHFQKILAITFTNKAATEMKERILDNLSCFAKGHQTDMLQDLIDKTELDAALIQKKSHLIIEAILQDYSALGITTIDSFTHRIIRSFAYDFGLSMDFDIEMDANSLLQEAVDAVIDKIGVDKELTKALVRFSIQKSNDDKSWDISKTIHQFARILLNESDKFAFKDISEKPFTDYIVLQKNINKQLSILYQELNNIGEVGLEILKNKDLLEDCFNYQMLPKYFRALIANNTISKTIQDGKLLKRFEDNTLLKKSVTEQQHNDFENNYNQLFELYLKSEQVYSSLSLLELFKEGIIPLAVLSYINEALEQIKSDNNIRLIAEFNELIFQKIQDEPTPFIYERLGEKYQHFFIDEMQDTSELQWKNLAKLIENPLSQEHGSLLLVGDAKQAIYRWRGGKSEQFIDLADVSNNKPFQVLKKVADLDTNYRSFTEIINFNNGFFQHISALMQEQAYADIYKKGNQQKTTSKIGGYVQIDFLKKEKEDPDADLLYPKKVLEIIQNLDAGFSWKDVCVLVRKNKEGVAIASYLNKHGIAIISSESLLLASDQKVDFLINLLQSILHKNNKKFRLNILNFLHTHLKITVDKHRFFSESVHLNEANFYQELRKYSIDFRPEIFHQKTIYDAIEYSIRAFKLIQTSHAYLQYFLDIILEFQLKNGSNTIHFLQVWEQQKLKLSISMPAGKNAVQIMSIHKAKGLQFPVVIYPHDLNIYREIDPKIWYPIQEVEKFQGFKQLLIPFKKDLQFTNEIGFELYQNRRATLELDNYNILYVALTRAVEQLYVITDYKITKKGEENTDFFSGLFIHYLKASNNWDIDQFCYTFGDSQRVKLPKKIAQECEKNLPEISQAKIFISTDISDHQIALAAQSAIIWNTEQEKAIAFGNLVHEILAQIKTKDDIENAIEIFVKQGLIVAENRGEIEQKIEAVVTHPNLMAYFQQNLTIYNEREILTTESKLIIPDRLIIFPNKEVVIIDYKTGSKEKKHQTQIKHYADVLSEMGYTIHNTILVYIGETIEVIT